MDDIMYCFEYMLRKEFPFQKYDFDKDDDGNYYNLQTANMFRLYRFGFLDGQKG